MFFLGNKWLSESSGRLCLEGCFSALDVGKKPSANQRESQPIHKICNSVFIGYYGSASD